MPTDIALVTYDDAPDFEFGMPSVSVIRMPLAELGAEAARLLLDRIDTAAGAPRHTVLSPTLMVRASSASGGPGRVS